MKQFKQILYTDYEDVMIVAFCDLSELKITEKGTKGTITKLINIYTRKNPPQLTKKEVV